MRIAIIGRTSILLETAKLLHKNGHKIPLIITSKNSQSDNAKTRDFKKLSKLLNSKFYVIKNANDKNITSILKNLKLDIGISINNPLLLHKNFISSFQYGVLNAHSGDLPKYRGNACPNWAILNNEKKIGLTIHFMNQQLDSGDITMKKFFNLTKDSSITDFYNYAKTIYPLMFLEVLVKIQNKTLKRKKQSTNFKNILRTFPRNSFDGKIDWKKPTTDVYNLIRASSDPFLGAYTYYGTEKLYILEAYMQKPKFSFLSEPGQIVERKKTGEISVSCLDGFLVIKKIKFRKKIYEKPTTLIKTIHTRLGMNIEEEIEKISFYLKDLQKLID